MSEIASASINSFLPASRDAYSSVSQSEEPILEIPVSELEMVLKEATDFFNQTAALVQEAGILRGRELSRWIGKASASLKATGSPTEKLMLVFAYLRQLLAKLREALKARPQEGSKVIQVCSKIQARAIQIIDYIKSTVSDDPKRKEIALDSQQARILFSGAGGEPVSRKEPIRAMRRAEVLWPALRCGHRPNDGRQTMRLIAKVEDLQDTPPHCNFWQRSERRIALNL
jgi:hypothetical protein